MSIGKKRLGKRVAAGFLALVFAFSLLPATAIAEEVNDPDAGTYCGKKAHTHTEACYMRELICGQEAGTGAHVHTDGCYTETRKLICGMEEGAGAHEHSDACYTEHRVLNCGQAEVAGHTHTAACYEEHNVLTCTQPEVPAHTHTEACYEAQRKLVCTEEHEHTDACYTTEKVQICGKEETAGHTHGEGCYTRERTLICTQAETEGHSHTDACYTTERELTCGQGESAGHVHTDACYTREKALTCGQTEGEGHVHTDACYTTRLTCGQAEHTHTVACYADPTADVERPYQWEKTMEGVELTGDWAKDLLAIARTQLGYKQSQKNYIVDENGRKKYYTRYGDWYGDGEKMYADWCAGFVAFCAHYAQVTGLPTSFGCQKFMSQMQEQGLYHEVGTYEPKAGDIIFFRAAVNEILPTHVGIVASVTAQEIKAIEGNRTEKVDYFTYLLTDPMILGYGQLPENPDLVAPETNIEPTDGEGNDNVDTTEPTDGEKEPEAPKYVTEETTWTASSQEDTTAVAVSFDGKAQIPEGSAFVMVPGETTEEMAEAIQATRMTKGDGAPVVALRKTFELSFVDGEGNLVQPAEGSEVTLAFTMGEIANENLQVNVYHWLETETGLQAQRLSVEREGDTATVRVDGFSFYTVEFTYNEKQYVMTGGTTVLLSDILSVVGLVGTVEAVEVSDTGLFYAYKHLIDKNWYVRSLRPFDTTEWIRVTLDGIPFTVTLTDAGSH